MCMKLWMLLARGVVAISATSLAFADATVQLNNYSALMPVYYQSVGNLASGGDFYIEVWGGPAGAAWAGMVPIIPVGATTPIIRLKEPGFFDAGIGVIRFVFENGPVTLGVRGWYGSPTFEQAAALSNVGQSPVWSQMSGSWDPTSGLAPTGPSLEMRWPLEIGFPIPEPSTMALAILGGGLLLGGSRKKRI
jgi:hypothetical protein